MTIQLTGIRGGWSGRSIAVTETGFSLGRTPDNAIVLESPLASRKHVELRKESSGWVLYDRSSNGTLLNGLRVQQPTVLRIGDVIEVGSDAFRVEAVSTLAAAQAAPTAMFEAPLLASSELPRLVVQTGPNVGARFVLHQEVVSLGRTPDNHVVLEGPKASRKHAEIHREGKHWVLKDLNAANGSFVNGQRIHRVQLTSGDILDLGDQRFLFEIVPHTTTVPGQTVPAIASQKQLASTALNPPIPAGPPSPIAAPLPTPATAMPPIAPFNPIPPAPAPVPEVRTAPAGSAIPQHSAPSYQSPPLPPPQPQPQPHPYAQPPHMAFPAVSPPHVTPAYPQAPVAPAQPPYQQPPPPQPMPDIRTAPAGSYQPQQGFSAVPAPPQQPPSAGFGAPFPPQGPAAPHAFGAPFPAPAYPQHPQAPAQPPAQPPSAAEAAAMAGVRLTVQCPTCKRAVDASYYDCPWDGTALVNGKTVY